MIRHHAILPAELQDIEDKPVQPQQYGDDHYSSVAGPCANAASCSYASSLHDNHHQVYDELRSSAELKADIVSHPLYEDVLQAHVECLSVGLPADHVRDLQAQLANKHYVAMKYLMLAKDPQSGSRDIVGGRRKEIDEFMENYLKLLISLKKQLEELILPPILNATIELCEVEQAFCDLIGASSKGIPNTQTRMDQQLNKAYFDIENDGVNPKEESPLDINCSLLEHIRGKLKQNLKERYRETITTVRNVIIAKDQARKLHRDTTILKKWWSAHSNWPYPTEEEKRKMVQDTKLNMQQVNNWFINKRRRHRSDRVA